MTSVHQNPPPKIPSGLILGLVIALALIGIPTVIQRILDQQRFDNAVKAYGMADCTSAVSQFNQIISAFRLFDTGDYVSRAQAKKAECEFFQNAVVEQQAGKFEPALLGYAKIAVYDDSALLEPTRKQLRELFKKASIASLATLEVCNRLAAFVEKDLFPKSDTNVASLYPACAKRYESNKNYKRAITIYEQFLKQYPDEPLVEDVRRALARTTVADIKGEDTRDIKSPTRTGTTEDGSTVVEIQNNSPAKMQIIFSGVTPKFEELATCQDCVKYTGKIPLNACPGKGHIGRYKLEPGQYDVAVKFTADDGSRVKPWAGNWNLNAGDEYKSCFFIVQDPEDEQNDSIK